MWLAWTMVYALHCLWDYSTKLLNDQLRGNLQKKQARKAHSSAFCIDLHRQTLMAMMDNDHNDGQWWQWRQWCHWRYRWFTHLPHLSTLSWRQCLRTGTLPIPLRNLPQSQCFALALVGGHILQWRRQEIFRYFKI